MGSDGVSEVGAGAGERVGRMVNWTSLAAGSIEGPVAYGGVRPMGAETCVHSELAEVGGFLKVTEGSLVRRSCVEESEERMWNPSLRIYLRQ